MRWLIKLVCPPGGIALDPFSGSGTTGCAAKVEGIDMVLIERDLDSHLVGKARCEAWQDDKTMAIIREQEKEEKDPTQLDMFASE